MENNQENNQERNASLDLEVTQDASIKSTNDLTIAEAIAYLEKEGYVPPADQAMFYVPYVAPVDEKPEQLIGVESEDEAATDHEDIFLTVVAAGRGVEEFAVGDRVLIHPRFFMTSVLDVPINGLKFGLFKEGLVSLIKKA